LNAQKPFAVEASVLVFAGFVAAFQVGKVAIGLGAIRQEFGLTLVQASWLVSVLPLAGAMAGIASGLLCDRLGWDRALIIGLVLLGVGSFIALFSAHMPLLLLSRIIESAGFLLVAVACPKRIATIVPVQSRGMWMGIWGTWIPSGVLTAMLIGPALIAHGGWRWIWFFSLALVVCALGIVLRVLKPQTKRPTIRVDDQSNWRAIFISTLSKPRAWLPVVAFFAYSAQWIGIFSLLPSIYVEAGVGLATAGLLTALGVGLNILGNLSAGWAMHRGVARSTLIVIGSIAMALGAWIAFGSGASFEIRYLGVCLFSMVGGLVPATIFATVPWLFSKEPHLIAPAGGLMQQGSSLGQLFSPPLIASIASAAGGWQFSWVFTGAFALVAVLIALRIRRYEAS
jgi:MFS transporter, CP family, cyanate transporter